MDEPLTQDTTTLEQDAMKALAKARELRAAACKREIDAVLEKYHCGFDIAIVLRPGVVPQHMVSIIAKD